MNCGCTGLTYGTMIILASFSVLERTNPSTFSGRALLQLSGGNPVLYPIRDSDSNLMKGQTLTQTYLVHMGPLKVNWSKYNLGSATRVGTLK